MEIVVFQEMMADCLTRKKKQWDSLQEIHSLATLSDTLVNPNVLENHNNSVHSGIQTGSI